jgi:hypothetical protein
VATLWAFDRVRPESEGGVKAVLLALLFGAPMVSWSASGLEHPLQALLLLVVAIAPLIGPRYVWTQAMCFGALMLLRPETPLLLAAVGAALVLHAYFDGSVPLGRRLLSLWPLAVVPTLVFAALLAFRLQYFGDALPNPYYAKASSANFARVLNFVGGGWDYLYSWLAGSAAVMSLPFVLAIDWRKAPLPVWLGCAVVLGQTGFVLFAGGDFMGCWRFVSPMLPALALVVGYGLPSLLGALSAVPRASITALMAGVLILGTIKQFDVFALAPTASYEMIAKIALEFRHLGDRLGIEEPRVAHHDAGGTTYAARLDLVDLAGLGDRTIAKHLTDGDFLADYLFNKKRPDIIFGSDDNFAAASGFHLRPGFKENYVPLRWRDRPYMYAPLSHLRRDLADNDAVLEKVFEDGELVAVIVRD